MAILVLSPGPARTASEIAPSAPDAKAVLASESATESATRNAGQRRDHPDEPGAAMDAPRPDAAPAPDAWKGIQLVVFKSKRALAVYREGVFEKEFRIVLGLVPEGTKRHANDARTPEGLYRVTGRRRHEKWQHFLALDYPNAKDRARYEAERSRGAIPDDGGKPFEIGGDIGIHGNDREQDQADGVDWTKGCIALSAVDIEELNALVPVGTPVWIVK